MPISVSKNHKSKLKHLNKLNVTSVDARTTKWLKVLIEATFNSELIIKLI